MSKPISSELLTTDQRSEFLDLIEAANLNPKNNNLVKFLTSISEDQKVNFYSIAKTSKPKDSFLGSCIDFDLIEENIEYFLPLIHFVKTNF